MRRGIRIVGYGFVIATFLASVACHTLTYFGYGIGLGQEGDGVKANRHVVPGAFLLLHLACMISVCIAIWSGRRDGSEEDATRPPKLGAWFAVVAVCGCGYFGYNFLRWVGTNEEKVVFRPDGTIELVTRKKGQPIREIDSAEARWHLAHQFRSMNGHWVFFSSAEVAILASRMPVTPAPDDEPIAAPGGSGRFET
jgi:hypothetical protein